MILLIERNPETVSICGILRILVQDGHIASREKISICGTLMMIICGIPMNIEEGII